MGGRARLSTPVYPQKHCAVSAGRNLKAELRFPQKSYLMILSKFLQKSYLMILSNKEDPYSSIIDTY